MAVKQMMRLIRHPVLVRMGIATPAGVFVLLVCARLGMEINIVFSAFVTMPMYLVVDFLLSDAAARKDRVHQVQRYLSDNMTKVAQYALLLGLTAWACMNREVPGAPFPRYVQVLVEIFGLPMVLVMPVLRSIFKGERRDATFGAMMGQFVLGMAALSVTVFFIGVAGDTLYLSVVQHPDEASVAAVAILICLAIVKVSAPAVVVGIRHNGLVVDARHAVALGMPTERDGRYIAAHEAGHALVYAALGALPAGINLVLNDKADATGALGFISNVNPPHHLPESRFVEWYLHMLLAGKAGEEALYSTATLGSSQDQQRWLNEARAFLASQEKGTFYVSPQSKLELEWNEAKLETLKAQQQETLRNFFVENADLHKALALDLQAKRNMDREALIPYLARVRLVAGMPLPYGEFDHFNHEVLAL